MARISTSDFRLFLLGLLMVLGLAGIACRLWLLQVVRGDQYASKVGGSLRLTVRIPSVRGEIRDRNGIPLVQNRASYNVDFYLPEMVTGYRQRNGKVPKVVERTTVRSMYQERPIDDVVRVVNSGVIPRLQELDLAHDYNAKHLKKHFNDDLLVPFTYIEDIDFPTIAKFSEHDVGLPGVEISVNPVRQYLYGAFAAHILGYVGLPRDFQELPDVKDFSYYQPDVEGKNQIEQAMDEYLRGEPGKRTMQRDVKGQTYNEVKLEPPKPGNNVYLTIDARIQYIVEQALRHPSLGRAAAVVLDPNNGDILAMGSVPSFDPNIFVPSVSRKEWGALMKDPAVPLINRAVRAFPPGSTFKIVTALAGLSKGLDKKTFDCPGGVQYGDHFFHCWIKGQHGVLGLSDALKVSCDSFFYQYGNAAGMEAFDKMADVVGIGHKPDIGLTDASDGVMPGPQWLKDRYNIKWTEAYTANASIGQGYVLASPLQMAMAYATVANGGVSYEPRLVRTVLSPDGKPVLGPDGKIAVPDEPKVRTDLREYLRPEQIEAVRHGLWEVVNADGGPGGGGTGGKVRMKDVVVAGKTGSAQSSDRGKEEMIAWFCCFAPYEHPKYVIAVMVQGGHHGGGVAGPVAARILRQCIDMDSGKLQVKLAPLAPAHSEHPFDLMDALPPYPNDESLSVGQEDESDSAQEAPPAKVDLDSGSDRRREPDIKSEPDDNDQGKVAKKHRAAPTLRAETATARPQRGENAAGRAAAARHTLPAAQPEANRNFFERLFNQNRKQTKPASSPSTGGRQ